MYSWLRFSRFVFPASARDFGKEFLYLLQRRQTSGLNGNNICIGDIRIETEGILSINANKCSVSAILSYFVHHGFGRVATRRHIKRSQSPARIP